jgi:mycoredoxin
MSQTILKLYGADWCTKSSAIRNFLQSNWVTFQDFDVELDSDAEAHLRSLYQGALKFPTVEYGDEFLKNPTIPELIAFLELHKLLDN